MPRPRSATACSVWGAANLGLLKSGPYNWANLPSDRHRKSANLSFLDGHVESRRWLHTPKIVRGDITKSWPPVNELDRRDLMWLYERTYFWQWREHNLNNPAAWPAE